ncbi:MAG: phosphorylase family protein [Promethearchaeota archaeon]
MLNRIKAELLNFGLKFLSVDEKIVRIFLEAAPSRVKEIVILPAIKSVMKQFLLKLKNKTSHGRIFNGTLNGVPVSVIRSFVGCPNMAITMECLKRTKAKIVIRIDYCGGLNVHNEEIRVGDTIIPKSACSGDGTCLYYLNKYEEKHDTFSFISNPLYEVFTFYPGANTLAIFEPDEQLKTLLLQAGKSKYEQYVKEASLYTIDALFCETTEVLSELKSIKIQAIDMESSILFLLGKLFNLRVASILSISDLPGHPQYDLFKTNNIHPELENGFKRTMEILMDALPRIQKLLQ